MARLHYTNVQVESKREAILMAAQHLLDNGSGIDDISFRKIAAELKCSYSAPYRYFASKDEVLIALRARAFKWMAESMRKPINFDGTASEKLEILAQAYIHAGLQKPKSYALMFFELDNLNADQQSLELIQAKNEALDVCTDVINEGQENGEFAKSIDPLTASHLFWTSAHGLVSLQLAGQLVMGRTVEQLAPVLIRTLRLQLMLFHDEASENMNIEPAAGNLKTG